ncbi:DUF6934 family protein [Chitinophaga ginsengisoli]|uniref:Uncharacterized protein n=1 Tax=Chitinophaga ginsengisoli TaxID=363837 RepID=A0A2P8GDR3_9BACT|nr:hypothetical protein [Chitinophaga ginsengisoli]PSL32086.1 hypothetical protein CLV42_104389 [Chitinophaga ginsengisoli]
MAIAVKINFDDVYDINTTSCEMKSASFDTELADGNKKKLMVAISDQAHELMPNVYNLAFGPLNANGKIDDKAQIKHRDYSKAFSTILLHARTYLAKNPAHYLGIDGSNNSRALLYYRIILDNFEYLSNYFNIGAMKYYVRIARFGKHQYENPFDFKDVKSSVVKITRDSPRYPEFLYNYFIFTKK